MELKKDFSLKPYNTFGIDLTSKYFIEVTTLNELQEFLSAYRKDYKALPLLVMGGGSNILFTENFKGIVLKISTKGIEIVDENEEHISLRVYAGEVWDEFVGYCVDKGLGGIENLSMIPGNVGSCPVQNIGAYGAEVKDVLTELETIEIETGRINVFPNEMCRFGYRDSIFKKELMNRYIIHTVVFRLSKRPVCNIKYGAIEEELKGMGNIVPDLRSVREAVCSIRSKKLPDVKKFGNAGSFFKNPTVTEKRFNELKAEYPGIVGYPIKGAGYKLAAGYLIETCGWKGKRKGNCGVYENQALLIVNYGNATGKEIAGLAEEIKESVFDKYKVILETEVNIF
jgi:UDP-N-acetylmuramate dehydrogenase